ncbi:MAG: hypothetical protein RKH07_11365 [Gammaproteobacteria bacterium]
MTTTTPFHPFFDPLRDGESLSLQARIAISVAIGLLYGITLYGAMEDKVAYIDQGCWVLSAVITTCVFSLYLATDIFRHSLTAMNALVGNNRLSNSVIQFWLSDRAFVIAGVVFALVNASVAHLLGVPTESHNTAFAYFVLNLGFIITGFAAGMGLWAICAVIVLYLKFATTLQHTLNPNNPDGLGGIKVLSDALWYFAMLTAAVGLMVATYMFSADWTNLALGYVRDVFVFWISLPFIMAISIVLIPGLAVRRQVDLYKSFWESQLLQERAQLYSMFKKFKPDEDDEIITAKKELNDRMQLVQAQLKKLRGMRSSHIDITSRTK